MSHTVTLHAEGTEEYKEVVKELLELLKEYENIDVENFFSGQAEEKIVDFNAVLEKWKEFPKYRYVINFLSIKLHGIYEKTQRETLFAELENGALSEASKSLLEDLSGRILEAVGNEPEEIQEGLLYKFEESIVKNIIHFNEAFLLKFIAPLLRLSVNETNSFLEKVLGRDSLDSLDSEEFLLRMALELGQKLRDDSVFVIFNKLKEHYDAIQCEEKEEYGGTAIIEEEMEYEIADIIESEKEFVVSDYPEIDDLLRMQKAIKLPELEERSRNMYYQELQKQIETDFNSEMDKYEKRKQDVKITKLRSRYEAEVTIQYQTEKDLLLPAGSRFFGAECEYLLKQDVVLPSYKDCFVPNIYIRVKSNTKKHVLRLPYEAVLSVKEESAALHMIKEVRTLSREECKTLNLKNPFYIKNDIETSGYIIVKCEKEMIIPKRTEFSYRGYTYQSVEDLMVENRDKYYALQVIPTKIKHNNRVPANAVFTFVNHPQHSLEENKVWKQSIKNIRAYKEDEKHRGDDFAIPNYLSGDDLYKGHIILDCVPGMYIPKGAIFQYEGYRFETMDAVDTCVLERDIVVGIDKSTIDLKKKAEKGKDYIIVEKNGMIQEMENQPSEIERIYNKHNVTIPKDEGKVADKKKTYDRGDAVIYYQTDEDIFLPPGTPFLGGKILKKGYAYKNSFKLAGTRGVYLQKQESTSILVEAEPITKEVPWASRKKVKEMERRNAPQNAKYETDDPAIIYVSGAVKEDYEKFKIGVKERSKPDYYAGDNGRGYFKVQTKFNHTIKKNTRIFFKEELDFPVELEVVHAELLQGGDSVQKAFCIKANVLTEIPKCDDAISFHPGKLKTLENVKFEMNSINKNIYYQYNSKEQTVLLYVRTKQETGMEVGSRIYTDVILRNVSYVCTKDCKTPKYFEKTIMVNWDEKEPKEIFGKYEYKGIDIGYLANKDTLQFDWEKMKENARFAKLQKQRDCIMSVSNEKIATCLTPDTRKLLTLDERIQKYLYATDDLEKVYEKISATEYDFDITMENLDVEWFKDTVAKCDSLEAFSKLPVRKQRNLMVLLIFMKQANIYRKAEEKKETRNMYTPQKRIKEFVKQVDSVMSDCRLALHYYGYPFDCLLTYLLAACDPNVVCDLLRLYYKSVLVREQLRGE